MRGLSWMDRNVAVLSISISAIAYWMLMSGGSLLSTTDPGADRTSICSTWFGSMGCRASNASIASSGAWIGDPTVQRLRFVPATS